MSQVRWEELVGNYGGGVRSNNNHENSAQGCEMVFVLALFQPLIFILCQPKRAASNQP